MLISSSSSISVPLYTLPPRYLHLTSSSSSSYSVINTSDSINSHRHHHSGLLSLLDDRTPLSHLKQIHAKILRTSSTDHHDLHPRTAFLFTRLLYFASFIDIGYAFQIFSQFQAPNSFSWNTLIRACANSPTHKPYAFAIYRRMVAAGDGDGASAVPDKHTFPFVLKACGYLFDKPEGEQAHAQLLKLGLGSDVYINSSLVHFYASCGMMDCARRVFDKMPKRTRVSWNAMIDALVRSGDFAAALDLFAEMQGLFEPDGYTMQSVVSACAGLGALSLGMWAHAYVLKKCDTDVMQGSTLMSDSIVDMYCKCGMMTLAQQVFDQMPRRDVSSWNWMILGFAMHGKAEMAVDYFRSMIQEEGKLPNSVTFVGVLSACKHSGKVDEGRGYFDMMVRDYKIKPQLEHYGCLIDLLARAGLLDEALDLVSQMPMKPDGVIWRSLLDACSKYNGGLKLSEEIAQKILLDPEGSKSSGVYVLLSKIYASAARWNDVGSIRKLMVDQGVLKEPGCSSIEVDGMNHEFFAGDNKHPQRKKIYQVVDMIDERLRLEGYRPDVSQAQLVNEGDDMKQNALRLHSERLAIAFGLLNMKPGNAPIRVFKNLRVCSDCHEVTKLISRVFGVEIIMRDRARFHHFKDGVCSCLDYW